MRKKRAGRCPQCDRELAAGGKWFPFCSERCRQVDLGKWLEGRFRIPGRRLFPEELPDSEEVH